MSAQETIPTPCFSERFDTPHCALKFTPVIRKSKAEVRTLACLCLIVVVPLFILAVSLAGAD